MPSPASPRVRPPVRLRCVCPICKAEFQLAPQIHDAAENLKDVSVPTVCPYCAEKILIRAVLEVRVVSVSTLI